MGGRSVGSATSSLPRCSLRRDQPVAPKPRANWRRLRQGGTRRLRVSQAAPAVAASSSRPAAGRTADCNAARPMPGAWGLCSARKSAPLTSPRRGARRPVPLRRRRTDTRSRLWVTLHQQREVAIPESVLETLTRPLSEACKGSSFLAH